MRFRASEIGLSPHFGDRTKTVYNWFESDNRQLLRATGDRASFYSNDTYYAIFQKAEIEHYSIQPTKEHVKDRK